MCFISKRFQSTYLLVWANINHLQENEAQRKGKLPNCHLALVTKTRKDVGLPGHGCEDFEGLYCMNLSDHSSSTHASIQAL